MCFKHYVNPVVNYLSGRSFEWPLTKAVLQTEIFNKGDRTNLMLVKLQKSNQSTLPIIEPVSKQGSHMTLFIAHTDGYILASENNPLRKIRLLTYCCFSPEISRVLKFARKYSICVTGKE